jgi:hypothetical protein
MRMTYAIALATSLFAIPAMGHVVIQTPNGDAARHQEQADRDRAAARANHDQARAEAERGNYGAAAEAQRNAHQDWHASRQQEHRADEGSGAVVIGR